MDTVSWAAIVGGMAAVGLFVVAPSAATVGLLFVGAFSVVLGLVGLRVGDRSVPAYYHDDDL